MGRAGLRADLHGVAVARGRRLVFQAPDATGHHCRHHRGGGPGAADWRELPGLAPQQALGPHGQPAVQPLGSDAADPAEAGRADRRARVRPAGAVRPLPRSAERVPVRVETGVGRVRRHGQAAGRGDEEPGAGLRHRGLRLQGPDRARGVVRRAAADQWPDQGHLGQAAQGVLPPGSRREGHLQQRAHGVQHRSSRACSRTTSRPSRWCWRSRVLCRPMPRWS